MISRNKYVSYFDNFALKYIHYFYINRPVVEGALIDNKKAQPYLNANVW